ncbi:hypothetical protein NL676_004055 [Syzygium grande]|nr:hypothetical protein NL676_004055 [Syzygium grande]
MAKSLGPGETKPGKDLACRCRQGDREQTGGASACSPGTGESDRMKELGKRVDPWRNRVGFVTAPPSFDPLRGRSHFTSSGSAGAFRATSLSAIRLTVGWLRYCSWGPFLLLFGFSPGSPFRFDTCSLTIVSDKIWVVGMTDGEGP